MLVLPPQTDCQTAPASLHTLVIASEQVTPNLQFLLHVAENFRDRPLTVHIYCSSDLSRSAGPAWRLHQCLRKAWSGRLEGEPHVEVVQGGQRPQEVREQVRAILEQAPEDEWLINVTGGNKLMSAAATEVALWADLPRCRVIYCEINGEWMELSTDTDGLLSAEVLDACTDAIVPRRDTLDRHIPVEALVAAQFSSSHGISGQAVESIPLVPWTAALIRNHWRWLLSLSVAHPTVQSSSNGDAFERFVGAGLAHAGLKPLHSLKVQDTSTGKVVREVDLVGCAQGRLYCIDIKLPGATEEAKGTQLADVASLALALGGRGAVGIALRPGWTSDADTALLARALNVHLLTAAEAPKVFSTLLQWLEPASTLPDDLMEVERLLQAEASLGRVVLSDGSQVVSARPTQAGVLALQNELQRMALQGGRAWALANRGPASGYQLLVFKHSEGVPEATDWPVLVERLVSRLESLAWLKQPPEITKSLVEICFSMHPGVKQTEMVSVLEQFLPWRGQAKTL